jgi:single-stranded DNA-binding protein
MIENNLDNNQIQVVGKINNDMEFSHELFGESFLKFVLKVNRLSDVYDIIPVTISERLLKGMPFKKNSFVSINGQFRSYNNYYGDGKKLILTIFARDIELVDENEIINNPNSIYLNGFICKSPIYRTTPFGREISDLLLAVNRAYNKSDYIPCIAWGRNARYSQTLEVGQNLKIWGRVQSREYQKKISEKETITRVAYEVSVSKMEILK